ncbi:RNA polymerase sigma factor [Diaminobutyricibacter sp. McL0618]|uniref:RNA polymerase sigma factor n=1 Tax=Leifsonia sp. McL0618 TaxID=3415677 RepID=UPI003CF457F3
MGIAIDEGASLWHRAIGGDTAAFGALFETHRDRVFGQALRLMRSRHDAEDVTALVFLEAWRRRESVHEVDGSILPWLLVTTNYVARNAARAMRRHHLAMASIPAPSPEPDFAPDVDDRLDRSEQETAARAGFARLNASDQAVVTLCVIEGLTNAQAAVVLGVPAGTVKSRLSRAKRRLAENMPEAAASGNALGGA